jgi:hypothetical protein
MVAVDGLVVHGWDLARVTGRPFSCDPETRRRAWHSPSMISAPGMEAARAPALDRVLGMSGRDPACTPRP